MNEVMINVKGLEIEDLFKKDLVTIEELVDELTNLKYEKEHNVEEYKELVRDVEDNYRPISQEEQYDINENYFS